MDAATDLAQNLYNFLAGAIAVFNATGIDYPALQQRIRDNIPLLTDTAADIHQILLEDAHDLAEKQELYSQADDVFDEGAKLWLPMFFLIPIGVTLATALLTYFITIQYRNRSSRQQQSQEVNPPNVEAPVAVPPLAVTEDEASLPMQITVEEPPALYDNEGEAAVARI